MLAPLLLYSFLAALQCMNNKCTKEAVKAKMDNDYMDVLRVNWYLWPGVQLVNFYAVPVEYRILVVQVVALFWNTFLSYKANYDQADEGSLRRWW